MKGFGKSSEEKNARSTKNNKFFKLHLNPKLSTLLSSHIFNRTNSDKKRYTAGNYAFNKK